MVTINTIQFINTYKTRKTMKSRKFNEEYNSLAIIDELIMELSYIRTGSNPSKEKLQKGIDAVEYLIKLSNEPYEEMKEEKLGISPSQGTKYLYTGKYKIQEYKEDLYEAQENIKKLMETPATIDNENIEKFQELLLKISLPIWKEQITSISRNRFKPIEL